MSRKGFTLIELLVVIAVISILAAVVLASLGSARNKGVDASAKQDLAGIRTQANIYYTGAGASSYGSMTGMPSCAAGMYAADAVIASAVTHVTGLLIGSNVACNVGPTDQTFAVAVKLKGTGYFCVDSTNAGKVNTAATGLSGAGSTNALNTTTGLCS